MGVRNDKYQIIMKKSPEEILVDIFEFPIKLLMKLPKGVLRLFALIIFVPFVFLWIALLLPVIFVVVVWSLVNFDY